MSVFNLRLGLGLSVRKKGVPYGALFIGGVPITINGGYLVIGART